MGAAKRQRRTAEEARRQILDAAETRLVDGGPDGIRLQQIASDVGISHPAILHHFGNRETLIAEVVTRAIERLQADLLQSLASGEPRDRDGAAQMLDRVYQVFGEAGHARVLAWLILTGYEGPGDTRHLRALAEATHARRIETRGDSTEPDFEDSQFRALLSALALFGDAIVGKSMRRSAGLGDDPDAGRRFREWLARLLTEARE